MATQKAGTVKKVADLMRDLDFCMFTTHATDGELRSRPMSNNGEVEFDGDVWFFTDDRSEKVAQIEKNDAVNIAYASKDQNTHLSISGRASV